MCIGMTPTNRGKPRERRWRVVVKGIQRMVWMRSRKGSDAIWKNERLHLATREEEREYWHVLAFAVLGNRLLLRFAHPAQPDVPEAAQDQHDGG
jgi:hypothetical protein